MPRPPWARRSGRSSCTNRSKTCGSASAVIPGTPSKLFIRVQARPLTMVRSIRRIECAATRSVDRSLGIAGKKTRAKRGSTGLKAIADKPLPGVTYRHPKTGDEWTAPANLRRVKKWLAEMVSSSGKKYEDFAARK